MAVRLEKKQMMLMNCFFGGCSDGRIIKNEYWGVHGILITFNEPGSRFDPILHGLARIV